MVTVADEGVPDPKGRIPCVYLRNPQKKTLDSFLSVPHEAITRAQSSAIRKAIEASDILTNEISLLEVR